MTDWLGLFEGVGIELEYMIVDRTSLNVRPLSDQILYSVAGAFESEVEVGELAWSNELVTHVIELKTNGPRESLDGLSDLFHRDIGRINALLERFGACLMPTGMHPWMEPRTETHLWPHEHNRVYEAFDRIFGCSGHGWSNLQSVHINLPFRNDDEFGRLHAAIRLVLPILPALAASSPFADGVATGSQDTRLEHYRRNCARIPGVTGSVIPEGVFTESDYQTRLLGPLYRDIAPFDPERVLQYEWLNARGAIARFDRHTIEIRLLDIQECPEADMAISAAVIELVRALVDERWVSLGAQQSWSHSRLWSILETTIRDGDRAEIGDRDYLSALGIALEPPVTAGAVWGGVTERLPLGSRDLEILRFIVRQGSLAARIGRAWSGDRDSMAEIYRSLCECLAANRMFEADD